MFAERCVGGMMQTKFKITANEYAKAVRLSSRLSLKVYLFLVTILVVVCYFLSRSSSLVTTVVGIGAVVLAWCLVLVILRYVIFPTIHKRHYRRHKTIQDEMTVRVDDDGIEFSSEDGHWKLPWGKTHKWRESSDYVLVYPMPRMFYLIPKTVDGPNFEIGRLTELLSTHVGPAT